MGKQVKDRSKSVKKSARWARLNSCNPLSSNADDQLKFGQESRTNTEGAALLRVFSRQNSDNKHDFVLFQELYEQ